MNSPYIGALDIGGTKIAASIADESGPLARITQPTIKTGTSRALPEQANALLKRVSEKAGIDFNQVQTVGVSSCGPFVRTEGGLGLATPNICGGLGIRHDLPNDWTSIPLEAVLRERFEKVIIENDCVAALIAERCFGAAQNEANCVYVTWSTGIGFGLCVDGKVLHGKHGNAGHAGHMLLQPQSSLACGCGNYGDVEALVSGRNLSERYSVTTRALFEAARDNNNSEARIVVAEAAQWFGRALYNLAVTLDSKLFMIGGSVWEHHGDWLEPLVRKEIDTRLQALTEGVNLVPAGLQNHVADIGAFCLVIPESWSNAWRASQPWQRLL